MAAFNYTTIPPVVPVDQGPAPLCWLAATAAVFGWKSPRPVTMQQAASQLGVEYVAKYNAGVYLKYEELSQWITRAGMRSERQQCIAPQGWDSLLRQHGPLITLVDGSGAKTINHAVVVFGIRGDGSTDGTFLKFANGNGGIIQDLSLRAFTRVFEINEGTDLLFSVSYLR